MNVFYILSCAICHLIALLREKKKTKGARRVKRTMWPVASPCPDAGAQARVEYIIRPNLQSMDSTGWNRGRYEVVKRLASNA